MSEFAEKRKHEKKKAKEKQLWKRVRTGAGILVFGIIAVITGKKLQK